MPSKLFVTPIVPGSRSNLFYYISIKHKKGNKFSVRKLDILWKDLNYAIGISNGWNSKKLKKSLKQRYPRAISGIYVINKKSVHIDRIL